MAAAAKANLGLTKRWFEIMSAFWDVWAQRCTFAYVGKWGDQFDSGSDG